MRLTISTSLAVAWALGGVGFRILLACPDTLTIQLDVVDKLLTT